MKNSQLIYYNEVHKLNVSIREGIGARHLSGKGRRVKTNELI
jgi:hypothetical protein